MLLQALALEVESYLGTDTSAPALARIAAGELRLPD